jgi:hypothetical protein
LILDVQGFDAKYGNGIHNYLIFNDLHFSIPEMRSLAGQGLDKKLEHRVIAFDQDHFEEIACRFYEQLYFSCLFWILRSFTSNLLILFTDLIIVHFHCVTLTLISSTVL